MHLPEPITTLSQIKDRSMNTSAQLNLKKYTEYLPEVKKYLNELDHQDLWWTTVAMVGKINNENMDPQLLESIVETQKAFQNLRSSMLEALVSRYLNQANSEIILKSQATIDIIIRNLFERTADVGFLATDDDIVDYLKNPQPSHEDQTFIENRIREYVAKYSVYEDILLLKPDGEVVVKLNSDNPVTLSHDPLITEAIQTDAPYIEVYRHSDLFPNHPNSLIYAKRIVASQSDSSTVLGVLCLRFSFDEEMSGIFEILEPSENGHQITLVDETGTLLASNDHKSYPIGQKQPAPNIMKTPSTNQKGLSYTTQTHGYQGFYGLKWFCRSYASHEVAFNKTQTEDTLEVDIQPSSPIYMSELEETNLKVSTLLLIVILNGKITSLKRNVQSFLPVLDSFQDISHDIQALFERFIHHIHSVLIETIQNKVKFSAMLAVEIMDRNLYERANDCRWWALNSTFRTHLSQHKNGQLISEAETQTLTEILQYINQLYTVYTNIILYDHQGKVVAVSDPTQTHLIDTVLPRPQDTAQCLAIDNTQHYIVSDFHQTPLYDNSSTYLYHAAVRDWKNEQDTVGGIALVFDSAPEFKAMLEDTLPKYINQTLDEATFSVFTTPQGEIIASTNKGHQTGTAIDLPKSVQTCKNGDTGSYHTKLDGHNYLVGYKMSEGYREYKNGDGYQNDVLALVFTQV